MAEQFFVTSVNGRCIDRLALPHRLLTGDRGIERVGMPSARVWEIGSAALSG